MREGAIRLIEEQSKLQSFSTVSAAAHFFWGTHKYRYMKKATFFKCSISLCAHLFYSTYYLTTNYVMRKGTKNS